MPNNARSPQRDVTWRTGGPSVSAAGDGLEGAYTAQLFSAPSGGICKVIIPALSLTDWKNAFCSQAFTGNVGDVVLVMFDENKDPHVVSPSAVVIPPDVDPLPPGHEWSYTPITSPVTVTSGTESAGTTVISPAPFTPDGAPVMCEFWCPFIETANAATGQTVVCLFEGSTQIGRFGEAQATSSISPVETFTGKFRFTPTAAAHTYTVTAWQTGGSGLIGAGPGGVSEFMPAFVRFTKV